MLFHFFISIAFSGSVGCLVGSACADWWVEEMDRCRLEEETEKSFREELRRSFSYTERVYRGFDMY